LSESRRQQLDRLARRICAGEVVFFIGAGFSLDSEGNTAGILIARLVARFHGLSKALEELGRPEAKSLARKLRGHLVAAFSLKAGDDLELDAALSAAKPNETSPSPLALTVQALSQNYYLINDWMCSAFETLIAELAAGGVPAGFVERVGRLEQQVMSAWSAALPALDLAWYLKLYARQSRLAFVERALMGKALFLDTLGFDSDEVMCGKPMAPRLEDVVSNAHRLRPRHEILAWLAAEGLCPTVVTTNYDLLLDSAYRLAGLVPIEIAPGQQPPREDSSMLLPRNRRYRHFTRVAEANQFFSHGDAHESAVIHKIHGCVEAYREARRGADVDKLEQTLKTIVFTFREIQNWREDSWSRDHLATLMRTRTIVFAGYSGADPVIHDTFRTVYEDVARHVSRQPRAEPPPMVDGAAPHPKGARARAFFADLNNAGSFHGIEILRSASLASGESSPDVTSHPNLLTYHIGGAFPSVDDTLRWIYHLCARELQAQALRSEVSRLSYQLFGKRRADEEASRIVDAFQHLRASEAAEADAFDRSPPVAEDADVRRRFERMTRWTCCFSVALLREYQLAELLLRHPTEALRIQKGARYPWYRPLVEHPQWTAWGAVLELALRRSLAAHLDVAGAWASDTTAFDVIEASCPTILFRASRAAVGSGPAVRRALRIQLEARRSGFGRDAARPLLSAQRPLEWTLQPETVPWWSSADERRPPSTPCALQLWKWAAYGAEAFEASASFLADEAA
jgi:hypothetical protein